MQGTNERLVSARDYKGFSLKDVVYRPGALDMLAKPSRYGSILSYPKLFNQENNDGA
jgi:hypothetical protein